ncbi:MAG: DUF5992 family protein [Agarilytica sp.]
MKKISFGTVLWLASMGSYSATWSPGVTVESTFTEGSTDVIGISTSGGGQLTEGCLADRWIFVADSEERRGRAFSVILAAAASGKKISLWYDTENCSSWSYLKATSIKFIK